MKNTVLPSSWSHFGATFETHRKRKRHNIFLLLMIFFFLNSQGRPDARHEREPQVHQEPDDARARPHAEQQGVCVKFAGDDGGRDGWTG